MREGQTHEEYICTMEYVMDTIDNDGLDYAMTHYSDYKEVEDEEFHDLRECFLRARKQLTDYLGLVD